MSLHNKPWKKKNTESCFHVTMVSFDGAEIFELVSMPVVSLSSNKLDKQSTGLYRDDGLVLLRNTSQLIKSRPNTRRHNRNL